ncbi:hypothetical protein KIS1582_1891 [Cytobacillus firmus]|uniref:Uncharacterized protein n=1 Tax=Cytobacillus firmus TaxID=1399 RepID=A0A800NAT3_CYTFI|nr:hypothetical protein KIS1582_1891 [Cytobacillus firmus]
MIISGVFAISMQFNRIEGKEKWVYKQYDNFEGMSKYERF